MPFGGNLVWTRGRLWHIASAADARVMFGFGELRTQSASARDGSGVNDPNQTRGSFRLTSHIPGWAIRLWDRSVNSAVTTLS
jgi:hypothetical protein